MLLIISNTRGFTVQTKNGSLGTVGDFLFDDMTWKMRWMVVDTGQWLAGREVLVHPSSIGHIDSERRELDVTLTKAQVENSPDIGQDLPVSQQMRSEFYGPSDGRSGVPPCGQPNAHGDQVLGDLAVDDGDPHLRSVAEITGYHVHACDGGVGHVENLLAESSDWGIRYLIIDTRNWWPGKHVLISPGAVDSIDWFNRRIGLNIGSDKVKSSPPWNPSSKVDQAYQQRPRGPDDDLHA